MLHAAGPCQDHALLLLHVRHDPERRALARRRVRGQQLQHDIMGYLPGFATPRLVCDVPFVGKRWVHQVSDYDRERGISYWTKNYRTRLEEDDPEGLSRTYEYYDPIYLLPESGQAWWRAQSTAPTEGHAHGNLESHRPGNPGGTLDRPEAIHPPEAQERLIRKSCDRPEGGPACVGRWHLDPVAVVRAGIWCRGCGRLFMGKHLARCLSPRLAALQPPINRNSLAPVSLQVLEGPSSSPVPGSSCFTTRWLRPPACHPGVTARRDGRAVTMISGGGNAKCESRRPGVESLRLGCSDRTSPSSETMDWKESTRTRRPPPMRRHRGAGQCSLYIEWRQGLRSGYREQSRGLQPRSARADEPQGPDHRHRRPEDRRDRLPAQAVAPATAGVIGKLYGITKTKIYEIDPGTGYAPTARA